MFPQNDGIGTPPVTSHLYEWADRKRRQRLELSRTVPERIHWHPSRRQQRRLEERARSGYGSDRRECAGGALETSALPT